MKLNKLGNVTSDSYTRSTSDSPRRGRSRSLSPHPRVRFENLDRGRLRQRDSISATEQNNTVQEATCGACSLFNNSTIDVWAPDNMPQLTSVCRAKLTCMPVVEGKIGETKVKVLRDTGCSGVVVRKDLVDKSKLTGERQTCMLADGSRIKVPMALLDIDTTYFVGQVEAWCMDNPIYDLIVGNIEGARDPSTPYCSWEINAVQTRQQVKNMQKPSSSSSSSEF